MSKCDSFSQGLCQSCPGLGAESYEDYTTQKFSEFKKKLSPLFKNANWLDPQFCTPPLGSRTKAKWVVSGTKKNPQLGFLQKGKAIDIHKCPQHAALLIRASEYFKKYLPEFSIRPYQPETERGDLKGLILQTTLKQDKLRVRFIVKSTRPQGTLYRLTTALSQFLNLPVIASLNVHPLRSTHFTGVEEIPLTPDQTLIEEIDDVRIVYSSQSFSQVTPVVAKKLYQEAATWTDALPIQSLSDLFCGSASFALYCQRPDLKCFAVEKKHFLLDQIKSNNEAKSKSIDFINFDLYEERWKGPWTKSDLFIVNPPRRGLGPNGTKQILEYSPDYLLYSSCNPETLQSDANRLEKSYKIIKLKAFDMFPYTEHLECLALFEKR